MTRGDAQFNLDAMSHFDESVVLMSIAISSGIPWERRAMLTREGIILSKQAVVSFPIMASEMRVR